MYNNQRQPHGKDSAFPYFKSNLKKMRASIIRWWEKVFQEERTECRFSDLATSVHQPMSSVVHPASSHVYLLTTCHLSHLSISFCICPSIHLRIYPLCISVPVSTLPYHLLFIRPIIYLPAFRPSTHPPIYTSIPCVHLPIHPKSIHLLHNCTKICPSW